MDQKIAQVYRTQDYKKFKRLTGNRDVTEIRIGKIVKSIQDVGYVMNPIIINKAFEVIDGQGRLEALKRLRLPVDYIVVPDAGIAECISMNINQSNWKIEDYVKSYAEAGITDYTYLLQLLKQFRDSFNLRTICMASTLQNGVPANEITSGRFRLSASDYDEAVEVLGFLRHFKPLVENANGNKYCYYAAIAFALRDSAVDNQLLLDKTMKNRVMLVPVATTKQAFETLEAIYNVRNRNKVYIATNYQQYIDGKYADSRYRGIIYSAQERSGNKKAKKARREEPGT